MSSAPRRRTIVSSSIAPATARSARRGSRPGTRSRFSRSQRDELLADAAKLLRRDAPVAQRRVDRPRRRRRRHRAEAQNRSRRADHAVEPGFDDLVEDTRRLRRRCDSTSLRSSRGDERIALDEALGQTNDAELEAATDLDRRAGAARDLDAAAADVDDDRRLRRAAPTP